MSWGECGKITECLRSPLSSHVYRPYEYSLFLGSVIQCIEKDSKNSLLTVTTKSGEIVSGLDHVLVACGRCPNTKHLNLSAVGEVVTFGSKGYIKVDEFQETSVPNLFAVGDACGQVGLK